MVCLIKSKYKKEIKEYADILGSEDAAYYVIAMNNGYTLDKAPDGEASSLYDALVEYHTNNGSTNPIEDAIISKSIVYTPEYTNTSGKWYDNFDSKNGSTEPSITTLTSNAQLCNNENIKQLLKYDTTGCIEQFGLGEQVNALERDMFIQTALKAECDEYVREELDKFKSNNPNVTNSEIQTEIYKIKHQFYNEKLIQSIDQIKNGAKDIWNGIEQDVLGNYYPVDWLSYKERDLAQLRCWFINSLLSRVSTTGSVINRNGSIRCAAILVMRAALNNETVDQVIRPLVQLYLEENREGSLVQQFFEKVGAQSGVDSQSKLIRDLADEIEGRLTTDAKTQKKRAAKQKRMQKFYNAVRRIFNIDQKNYNTVRNIKDSITSFFTINAAIDVNAGDNVSSVLNDLITNINVHKTTPSTVISKIKQGIEARIKSITSVTGTPNQNELEKLNDLKQSIENINSVNDQLKQSEEFKFIVEFIANAINELTQAQKQLQELEMSGYTTANAKDLMRIGSDIIGFYKSITTNELVNLLNYNKNTDELAKGGIVYNAIQAMNRVTTDLEDKLKFTIEMYCNTAIDRFVESQADMTDDHKARFKENMKRWMKNGVSRGDLNWLENSLSGAISSQSPIVRMMDFLVRQANHDVRMESLTRGHHLTALAKELPFGTSMLEFCELDEDGKPTGNMVSEINRGAVANFIQQLKERLIKKYDVQRDENGGLLFENDDQWRGFYNEYDRALEDNGINRFFTADYYIAKRAHLSKDTYELQQYMVNRINEIKSKCYDQECDAYIYTNLSRKQQDELRTLTRQLEALSNPYEIEYDVVTGHINSLKLKTGDQLRMATELQSWDKYKRDKVRYNYRHDKFLKSLAAIESKYGKNSVQYRQFIEQNTAKKIDQRYYDEIGSIFGDAQESETLIDLKKRRAAIINACKPNKRGQHYQPNLNMLNAEAWAELKLIDELIAKERAKSSKKYTRDQMEAYQNIARKVSVVHPSTRTSYIKWLEDQANAKMSVNPNAKQEFYDMFYYEVSPGKFEPLSIFTFTEPVNKDYVITEISGQYRELDEDSEFVNDKYDKSNPDKRQPDKVKWHNKQYDEITANSKKKAFYDEMFKMMQDAWAMLPQINRAHEYALPQRSKGGKLRLVDQNGVPRTITTDDSENEDYVRKADGTIVNNIPLRWIKRLEDPTKIDTDIVRNISAFYEMAVNFQKKSEIAPLVDMMYQELLNTSPDDTPSDQARRIDKYREMYIYGKMRSGFKSNRKLSKREQKLEKWTVRLANLAHSKLMPHNLLGILKNWTDSSWSFFAEVSAGRHFTWGDYKLSIKQMAKEMFVKPAAGRANVTYKTAAMLQFSGVSGTIDEIFEGQTGSLLWSIMKKHFSMGEYTLIDYLFKGLIARCVFNTHRLVIDPSTGKSKFVNRQQAKEMYLNANKSAKNGINSWQNSTITLADAYEVDKEGNLKLKDEYLDIVKPILGTSTRRSLKLETRVVTTIKERSAVINGMLDEMDKNATTQNFIWALVFQMRGWAISQYTDFNKRGHDLAVYSDDKIIKGSNQVTKTINELTGKYVDTSVNYILSEDPDYVGQYNFSTGFMEQGAWVNLIPAYLRWFRGGAYLRHFTNTGYSDMTENQLYTVRRMNACITACATLTLVSWVSSMLLETFAKSLAGTDDDDKTFVDELTLWALNLAQAWSTASQSERTSQLGMFGFTFVLTDLVTSLAVSTSYVQDFPYLGALAADFLQMLLHQINNNEDQDEEPSYNQLVKTGSYKGLPKWQADAFRASSLAPFLNKFGANNIYKNISPYSLERKANWYHNMLPTKFMTFKAKSANSKNVSWWNTLLYEYDDQQQGTTTKRSSGNSMLIAP